MNRALLATALLLFLACSLAWGASAADLKSLDGVQGAVPMAKPTPPPPPPPPGPACPVSCWLDPTITCTSATGDCQHLDFKGNEFLQCDGVLYACPGF